MISSLQWIADDSVGKQHGDKGKLRWTLGVCLRHGLACWVQGKLIGFGISGSKSLFLYDSIEIDTFDVSAAWYMPPKFASFKLILLIWFVLMLS